MCVGLFLQALQVGLSAGVVYVRRRSHARDAVHFYKVLSKSFPSKKSFVAANNQLFGACVCRNVRKVVISFKWC